jgi:DNA-binding NarL/FixJ family response regulator
MGSANQVTVLLADDNALIRQLLRLLLKTDTRIRLVGRAQNGREAVEMTVKLRPDVVLMDISMPILNGLEATRQILAKRPLTKIVVLSAHDGKDYVSRARAVGAVGFVSKKLFTGTLIKVIHKVATGGTHLRPDKATGPARNEMRPHESESTATKERERMDLQEIRLLQLVAEGSPIKQIAGILRVSIGTVEGLLDALMNRLGITCLANLADYAIASGCIESDVVLTIT